MDSELQDTTIVVSIPAPAADDERRTGTLRLAARGGLAVLDQGLFSGSNFLASVLLARWLSASDFGAFSVAYSVFLLFAALHTAVLTEPMLVFGSGKYRRNFRSYFSRVLGAHWLLMIPSVVLLAMGALLLGRLYEPAVQHAFWGLVAGFGLILLLWLVRRAFYPTLGLKWPVAGGAIYLVVFAAAVSALEYARRLTPLSAFLTMAAASLVAGAFLLVQLFSANGELPGELPLMEVLNDHWRYGRWSAATVAVSWFPDQIYYLLLPARAGLDGAGALRAHMNLVLPMLQTLVALSMVLLPQLVTDREFSMAHLSRRATCWFGLFTAGALVYLGFIWVFQDQLFDLLYRGKYAEHGRAAILIAGLLPVAAAATTVLTAALRALERPDLVFRSYVAAAITAVLAGVPLARAAGLNGALGAMLLSALMTAAVMCWFFFQASGRLSLKDRIPYE